MFICLEQDADLHVAQLMPLPLTVSCFSKIQIGFTVLVPAHPGSPGKRAVKWVCVLSFYDKICFRVFFLKSPICHSKNRAEDRGAAVFHVRIWPRKLPHTFAAFNARYVRGHWATFGRTGF